MIEVAGDYFRIIAPVIDLSKAIPRRADDHEEEGHAEHVPDGAQRLIEGPASLPVRDMQGELVEPLGLDLSYFAKHGRINWDHKGDPGSILGQPVFWKLTKRGLFLRALLYRGVPKADEAWKLFEAGARLAWSVEGKVIERAKYDPTHVLRAYVINVALTPNPVCQDTYATKVADSTQPADEHVLSKTLSTTSGAVLIPQSLEGAPVLNGRDEILRRHLELSFAHERPGCQCLDFDHQRAVFVNGYRGAIQHFFECCQAAPELASELARNHQAIALASGRLKGEAVNA